MPTHEEICLRILAALPGARVEITGGAGLEVGTSLVVDRECLREVAVFLRDDSGLRLDFCSNVTGVDWPARTVKVKVRQRVGDVEKEVEELRAIPGRLEVVYHLFSMERKAGPVVLRVRTVDRDLETTVPSLTPVWRSCEFQEREVYDLFGVRFEGHPDLRRLLMWEGFRDHPMRKDYVEPDDFEYEPTPHDEVLERVQARTKREGGD